METQTLIRTYAEDQFDRLHRENSEGQRKIGVVSSSALEQIVKGFEKLTKFNTVSFNENPLLTYQICEALIPDNYTSDDVVKICFGLGSFEYTSNFNFEIGSGIYLSALVNNLKENAVELPIAHWGKRPSLIGSYLNGKNLAILGDTGESVGFEMKSGSIHVKGNAGYYLGKSMTGGSITVEGDAGGYVGIGSRGGRIHIKGNSGSIESNWRNGAEVVVNGKQGPASLRLWGG